MSSIIKGKKVAADPLVGQLGKLGEKGAASQSTALAGLDKLSKDDSVRRSISKDIAGAQQGAADQTRQLSRNIAKKGLGNTALGLGATAKIQQQASDKIGAARASFDSRKSDLLNKQFERGKGLVEQRLASGPLETGGRKGGQGKLLGTAVGGFFGSPEIGSAIGGALQG